MNRKIIAVFTLLAFVIFSVSCYYTTRLKEVRTAADWQGKKGKILWIIKKSGEFIGFSKDEPGRIVGDKIVGKAIILSKEVVIDRANIKRIKRDQKRNILEIISKDGKAYHVISGTLRKEKDKIIFFPDTGLYLSVSILLSDVKSVQVKRFDPLKILFTVAEVSVVVFVGALIWIGESW